MQILHAIRGSRTDLRIPLSGLPSMRMEHFYGVLVQSVYTEPWNRPVTPDKSHGSFIKSTGGDSIVIIVIIALL